MAELTRVPAPRSPFDGWRGRAVGLIVAGILLAIAKPWGDGSDPPGDRAIATPSPASADPPVVLTPVGQVYDPSALGVDPPEPRWGLLTAAGLTPLDFLALAPDGAGDEPSRDGEPIVSGPVIVLGTSDSPGAFAITHPSEVALAAVRLWRFPDGGPPRRVDLGTMPSPWPVRHAEVLGHRQSSMEADRVLPWDAGLYRLDLLIDPADAVRSIMLSVRPGDAAPPTDGERPVATTTPFATTTLQLLPQSANLWSVGRFLSGWYRETSRPGCRVAEIWRSGDPGDECWPIPLGGTAAIGVNLPGDAVVTAIELRGIDPLPGPAGVESRLDVDGRPGLAYVRAPDGGLSDGIYRLDVSTADATGMTWYFEIGPLGRAVAQYYQSSLSR